MFEFVIVRLATYLAVGGDVAAWCCLALAAWFHFGVCSPSAATYFLGSAGLLFGALEVVRSGLAFYEKWARQAAMRKMQASMREAAASRHYGVGPGAL